MRASPMLAVVHGSVEHTASTRPDFSPASCSALGTSTNFTALEATPLLSSQVITAACCKSCSVLNPTTLSRKSAAL